MTAPKNPSTTMANLFMCKQSYVDCVPAHPLDAPEQQKCGTDVRCGDQDPGDFKPPVTCPPPPSSSDVSASTTSAAPVGVLSGSTLAVAERLWGLWIGLSRAILIPIMFLLYRWAQRRQVAKHQAEEKWADGKSRKRLPWVVLVNLKERGRRREAHVESDPAPAAASTTSLEKQYLQMSRSGRRAVLECMPVSP
ncbi:hypothetical protein JHW43_005724 [Diplocarpon mali]|nr:hypothetical protein JHW43_005724 [Diplocarpon mali]